jgi:hypothetical protein
MREVARVIPRKPQINAHIAEGRRHRAFMQKAEAK